MVSPRRAPQLSRVREFEHEKLLVWQRAVALYGAVRQLTEGIHWPDVHLVNQLLRATSSISINIAEGASAYSPGEKTRFYRIALRSAAEAAVVMALMKHLQLVNADEAARLTSEYSEIIAMLTRLARRNTPPHKPRTKPAP